MKQKLSCTWIESEPLNSVAVLKNKVNKVLVLHWMREVSVNWPQTCMGSPASTFDVEKQLIFTSPPPPQKRISLLPQYYRIKWAGPGWVWLWKPGYWFYWHQTVGSSRTLARAPGPWCDLMLHSWKTNWRLSSSGLQVEQLKSAQTVSHWGR